MGKWDVLPGQSGMSLLVFLKEKLGEGVSAKSIKRAIDAGKCFLNGKIERFSARLVGSGDRIAFEALPLSKKVESNPITDSTRILHKDKFLIAFNKPSGISSDSGEILAGLQKSFGPLILLHRLDKETTGILLFAREEAFAKEVEALFRKRAVKKTYLAIVDGRPAKSSGVVENFLARLHTCQGKSIWGAVSKEKGLPAKTSWEVKTKGKKASLLICRPETGRTHQIRIHLSGIGHPILGDSQYGRAFACDYRPGRILLHALEIAFVHPKTGEMIVLNAPLPEDFAQAISSLILETAVQDNNE